MKISKDDFNTFLEGKISKERNESIETYLRNNLDEHRALKGTVGQEEKNDFSELLDALNQKLSPIIDPAIYTKSENKSDSNRVLEYRKFIFPLLAVAAVGVIVFFSVITSRTSYKNYLDSYPDIVTTSVRGDLPIDELTPLERGMISYNNGDMQVAKMRYDEFLLSHPTNTTARFYRAITELYLDNPAASLRELEIISNSGGSMQLEDGLEWYKALNFVALERYSEAIPLLKKIIESRHYKRKEASALLRKIE